MPNRIRISSADPAREEETLVSGASRLPQRKLVMDEFDLEIKTEFINEALMNLEEAEGSFMELEHGADKKPLLDKIFRLAHNLKGGSRAVGFGDVAEFTHQLENLVLKIQKGEVGLSPEVVTILLKSNDRLVKMLTDLKGDLTTSFNNQDLIAEIQAWLDGTVKASDLLAAEEPEVPAVLQIPAEPLEEELVTMAPASAVENPSEEAPPAGKPFFEEKKNTEKKTPEKGDEVIRVNLSRIDLLNNYVGELIVLQSVIQQQAQESVAVKLQASLRQMEKLSKDIQHLSMSLRMLPVKPLVQKLQRVVRDTAQALDKNVHFEVTGEHLDIDKSVLDRLADPLIHILRNAVDHGLESPEARSSAGKGPEGKIALSFSNEGNHLIIEVRDDGKGMDPNVLRKKALEKGLITEAQNLTEKQLIHLIFHPGFSTKTETSEISGRGVGMDVVKTNVEKIGGQVDVTTQIGSGTTFCMRIPLSLAVIEGLVVASERNRYVVPISQVQGTVNLKSQKLFHANLGIGTCFELRGNVVPLINIDEALGIRGNEHVDPSHIGLVVNVGDQTMALVVKDVLRSQQIVVKPLANGVLPQKGWVGSCVLGDGLPTLIVSPVDLLEGKISQKMLKQGVEGQL